MDSIGIFKDYELPADRQGDQGSPAETAKEDILPQCEAVTALKKILQRLHGRR